jgi:hypothetical protein
MSEFIVDLFVMIQIQHEHGEGQAKVPRPGNFQFQAAFEMAPVIYTGQVICDVLSPQDNDG